MSRERVEFLELPAVPLYPFPLASGEVGSRSAILSSEQATKAETRLVKIAPYWYWEPSVPWATDLEILVLDGALLLDDWEVSKGGHLYLPAGTPVKSITSLIGSTIVWMVNPWNSATTDPTPKYIANICDLPWVPVPDFEGRTASEAGSGLRYKMIHQDPVTTAYTLLSHMAAGWFDPRLEAHETWEELILLEGDFLMGLAGQVTGGTYIFRTGEEPHGPQATRKGAVWFARGNKQIDFVFSETAVAKNQTELYLKETEGSHQDKVKPWGGWT